MSKIQYQKAFDFDQAWLNFELDLPLVPVNAYEVNPFYVNRQDDPIPAMIDELMAPYYNPPKLFLSGHRGSGKSSEAFHLLAKKEITDKYWPVYFSIRDDADLMDLDYRDVLLAIGGTLFRQFHKMGGRLPAGLLKELDLWRGKVEEEITTVKSGKVTGLELGAGLEAFFTNASFRMRMEPKTRRVIRQVIAANVKGLIDSINKIINAIKEIDGRLPLVIIDDLDKVSMETSQSIFRDHIDVMTQPACAIVYLVSGALFFSKDFETIREQAYFLPNIILNDPNVAEKFASQGYATMKRIITTRMSARLIEPGAMMRAITFSGGIFRELVRVVRISIGKCRRRGGKQVSEADVLWAVDEIRNDFRRILEESDLALLRKIELDPAVQYHKRVSPLMQLSALLEYKNGKNWFGVHPIVKGLLHE